MQRGIWHQLGDKSQKLVLEQLENNIGVGAILSLRDLSLTSARNYSMRYRSIGAQTLIDTQFYNPDFTNSKLNSYGMEEYRQTISSLNKIGDEDLSKLSEILLERHIEIGADGVIAPAVAYEAGREEIVRLNRRLHEIATEVGARLGVPTYATVMLSKSVTSSMDLINTILSEVTSLQSDGWYYGFEFGPERIPISKDIVFRCCLAGLRLACTGKPVLHAYAGPMALLSFGFGATATAIGHTQGLWQFSPSRWTQMEKTGGPGDAPPRFFSKNLWGTIVYPDEIALLPDRLREKVLSHSPFSSQVASSIAWDRWEANKHLLYTIGKTVNDLSNEGSPKDCAQAAIDILDDAIFLYKEIAETGLALKDKSSAYQSQWKAALELLLQDHKSDFEYLNLLS